MTYNSNEKCWRRYRDVKHDGNRREKLKSEQRLKGEWRIRGEQHAERVGREQEENERGESKWMNEGGDEARSGMGRKGGKRGDEMRGIVVRWCVDVCASWPCKKLSHPHLANFARRGRWNVYCGLNVSLPRLPVSERGIILSSALDMGRTAGRTAGSLHALIAWWPDWVAGSRWIERGRERMRCRPDAGTETWREYLMYGCLKKL